MFWNELANGHHYVAAFDDDGGELVGYAGLALTPPDEAWINNIAVRRDRAAPGHRPRAAGRPARPPGAAAPSQCCWRWPPTTRPAQRLYDAYGFEVVGVRRGLLPAEQHRRAGDAERSEL